MGNISDKIDPQRRAKIYKRVNLIEAREQFANLKLGLLRSGSAESIDKLIALGKSTALNRPPISINFCSCFRYQGLFGSSTKYKVELTASADELDGERNERWELLLFLEDNLTTAKNDFSKYFLGLDKEQYEILYPTLTPAQTAQIVSSSPS